jgi:hypothetical protein
MNKTDLALSINGNDRNPQSVRLVLGPISRSAADGTVDEGFDASFAGIIARAIDLKVKA